MSGGLGEASERFEGDVEKSRTQHNPASLFEQAYGHWNAPNGSKAPATWPLEPAGAPAHHRPKGSIGPVDPTTLGLSRQAENMMLSLGTFEEELIVSRREHFGDRLLEGDDLVVGKLGKVVLLAPTPPRMAGVALEG